jgi:hypothetical protein
VLQWGSIEAVVVRGVECLDDVTGLGRLDNVMRVRRDGEGLDEAEERWGLGRLSFGFGFEQSKAWAGCDRPWAIILSWWVVFTVKIWYPILLVPDKWYTTTTFTIS